MKEKIKDGIANIIDKYMYYVEKYSSIIVGIIYFGVPLAILFWVLTSEHK